MPLLKSLKHPRAPCWAVVHILCSFFLQTSQGRYCVILDAGSSGSRAHVFLYTNSPAGYLPLVEEQGTGLKKKIPLSSFATQPQLAGSSLEAIIQYAEEQVPKEEHANTTIHLLATAGMRLLKPAAADAILESCRQVLENSAFLFKREFAQIVPGSTEGVYGFVSANYASGALQEWTTLPRKSVNPEFWGVLELGGASLQVTYRAEDRVESAISPFLYRLSLAGQSLSLFTHSFLGFGQDAAAHLSYSTAHASPRNTTDMEKEQAIEGRGTGSSGSVVSDPCLPAGYEGTVDGRNVSGKGVFKDCAQSSHLLVTRNCTLPTCGLGGLLIPPLTGNFLCIENLQYTAGFLGLPHAATLRQFKEAAYAVCSSTWQQMIEKYTSFEEEHLPWYCFGAAYGIAILQEGLGIDMDSDQLYFTDKIASQSGHETSLDWTLGAVVVAASAEGGFAELGREFPRAEGHPGASRGESDLPTMSVVLIVVIMLGIVFLAALIIKPNRWRRLVRTTRKFRRSLVKHDSNILSPNDHSEDDLSDVDLPWKSSKNGTALVKGRRPNSTKLLDLESGLETI